MTLGYPKFLCIEVDNLFGEFQVIYRRKANPDTIVNRFKDFDVRDGKGLSTGKNIGPSITILDLRLGIANKNNMGDTSVNDSVDNFLCLSNHRAI